MRIKKIIVSKKLHSQKSCARCLHCCIILQITKLQREEQSSDFPGDFLWNLHVYTLSEVQVM